MAAIFEYWDWTSNFMLEVKILDNIRAEDYFYSTKINQNLTLFLFVAVKHSSFYSIKKPLKFGTLREFTTSNTLFLLLIVQNK